MSLAAIGYFKVSLLILLILVVIGIGFGIYRLLRPRTLHRQVNLLRASHMSADSSLFDPKAITRLKDGCYSEARQFARPKA